MIDIVVIQACYFEQQMPLIARWLNGIGINEIVGESGRVGWRRKYSAE
jgi:hypothetical protein